MAEQVLRARITAEGGDRAAKEVEKLSRATEDLGKATEEATLATTRATEEQGRSALSSSSAATGAGNVAVAIAKIAIAVRSVVKAMGLLPAAAAVVQGSILIVRQLREEISERLRLAEVIERQGRALDELKNKQRSEKQALENVSDRRGFAGFDAATSTRVVGQAQRARATFSQLTEQDTTTALGLFGGLGLSQRDLTDLAIAASAGKIGVSPEDVRSPEAGLRESARILRRIRKPGGLVETRERRESQQGEGTGRVGFRPRVTEFEQDVLSEAQSPEGSSASLRGFLAKLQSDGALGPEADVDLIVRLIKTFNSSAQLRNANLTPEGFFPGVDVPTTGVNRLGIRPMVDIERRESRSFVDDIVQRIGLRLSEKIPLSDLREAIEALRRIEEFGTTGDVSIVINNQNQRLIVPSSEIKERRTRNGQNLARSRENLSVG